MVYLYRLLCAIAIIHTCTTIHAQDHIKVKIGIEGGATTYFSDFRENSAVRGTNSVNFYDSSPNSDINTSLNRNFLGFKAEIISNNEYMTLQTGLRYTHIKSTIDRNDFWDLDHSTKFYILYNQNGMLTEYAQAKEVKQDAEYLGIPIEVKLYISRPRFFRMYAKMGLDLNLNISNRTSIDFVNSYMQRYEQQVANALGNPATFFSSLNPCLGFKFGDKHSLNVNLEVAFPSYFITNNISSIVTGKAGIGAQIYFSYPIL